MTTAQEEPGRRRWRRRLAFALVSLLAVVVGGEAAVRLADGDGPRVVLWTEEAGATAVEELVRAQLLLGNGILYAEDPGLGALLAPSRRDLIETIELTYTLRTDHAGFPNPEPWPDRIDVAVLGNSLLVGPGVEMEGQFTTLMAERLGGARVLNLGLPGGGTEHHLLMYRRFAEPLEPRLVVSTLWVTWDVGNSLQFADWQSEGKPDPDYTRYRGSYGETHRRPQGAAAADEVERSMLERATGLVREQLGRSALLRAGSARVRRLLGERGLPQIVRLPGGDEVLLSRRRQETLARGVDIATHVDMRDVFFEPLEQLRAEVEASGGRFFVALVPSKEEIYAADAAPRILRSIEQVRTELQARGLPVLDLYPAFREAGRRRAPFYLIDIHLNELGNGLVADAVVERIESEGILARSAPDSGAVRTR